MHMQLVGHLLCAGAIVHVHAGVHVGAGVCEWGLMMHTLYASVMGHVACGCCGA